jgi:hypothetical protein
LAVDVQDRDGRPGHGFSSHCWLPHLINQYLRRSAVTHSLCISQWACCVLKPLHSSFHRTAVVIRATKICKLRLSRLLARVVPLVRYPTTEAVGLCRASSALQHPEDAAVAAMTDTSGESEDCSGPSDTLRVQLFSRTLGTGSTCPSTRRNAVPDKETSRTDCTGPCAV